MQTMLMASRTEQPGILLNKTECALCTVLGMTSELHYLVYLAVH